MTTVSVHLAILGQQRENMGLQGKLVDVELSDLCMRRLLDHCDCSECRRQEMVWLRLP